jgi:dihydroorotase
MGLGNFPSRDLLDDNGPDDPKVPLRGFQRLSPLVKPGSRKSLLSLEGPAARAGTVATARIEIDPESGLITSVGPVRGAADLLIGPEGLILPGLIDLHVHAREDSSQKDVYKEDFRSAGEAAISGGVTAFADMPNNPAPPVDDESYRRKRELARRAEVDVLLYAGIGPRTHPLSFPAPYKAYMGPSVGELFFESEGALCEALERYRGQWVAFHAESPEVLRDRRAEPTHAARRPPEAEVRAVELALALGGKLGIEVHICHLSTAGGLEAIRAARRRGLRVSCEVTPHHLFFDLEEMEGLERPGLLQCNPPIRPRADRLALLEGLRAGEIDLLASDHAPHSLEENQRGISGIPHLDTFGPFLFWLREQGFSWETLRRAASESPGRVLERFLGRRFGRIEEGAVGSLTVLDSARPLTIRRSALRTRAGWSPFEGFTFPGRVTHTIVRGKVHTVPAG